MKCKYRFPVTGRVKVVHHGSIPVGGWVYDLEVGEDGLLQSIVVTVPLQDPKQWPMAAPSHRPGIKMELRTPTPHLPLLRVALTSLQGILALFGLESIELDNPGVEWLPETADERTRLGIFSIETQLEPLPARDLRPVSFDLLARAVMVAESAADINITTNFFRHGCRSLRERSFVIAIYHFFFVLESEFGNGQFKKAGLKREFCSSRELRAAIEEVMASPDSIMLSPPDRKSFDLSYGGQSVEEVIERFIEIRGLLHHHSKNRVRWHPNHQSSYEIDAVLLQAVTFKVVFSLVEPYMWHTDVLDAYDELRRRHGGA